MAGQRILLGWYLDGARATEAHNTLGESVVGPLGMLTLLETQLGLLKLQPAQAERVVQYEDCLRELDSPTRFYHQSFATDPLGTASHLLDWRDHWLLHGWTGDMPSDAPRRLQDMAAVEALAAAKVSLCIGQRLQAVEAALQVRTPDIEAVTVVEPLETWPLRWRAVFKALPVSQSVSLEPASQGFLGRLQRQLEAVANDRTPEPCAWEDDGTVCVVQAETPTLAAHWLATELAKQVPTLMVCADDGARLDAHLAALDLPRQGLTETSEFRPALQVLPLVLDLLWDPLNFEALLQFLTHPVCPIPEYARWRLAQKVANAPGIGGTKWERTLKEIGEHYDESRFAQVREVIREWLEHGRYPVEKGAPLVAVIERVESLLTFFRNRLGETDNARRAAFNAAHGQCKACLESLNQLQAQGTEEILPRQLQKLVTQATARGSTNPLSFAEVGAHQIVTEPAAVVEPLDRVIWSPLKMPSLPDSDPWSSRELTALKQVGVELASVKDQLKQAAASWLRPVMAARTQLVLVLPPSGEEVHPLWQTICAVTTSPTVHTLESLIAEGAESLAPVTPVPLPEARRWWQLPEDVSVELRETESFSSLEKLLFNPYQWLLQYPAKLKTSQIASLGGNFRLFGNLAHGLIEQYFQHPKALSMSEADFEAWFTGAFTKLVDHEGASLRGFGKGADLEGFRYRVREALRVLRTHVRDAGMGAVVPEQLLAGHFAEGVVKGKADLVMTRAHDKQVIVDMKWAGQKKYREKLAAGRHLQLVIYAALLHKQSGRWPALAYYILNEAQLLAASDHVFPQAEVVMSGDEANIAELWQCFLATWRWRIQQVHAGQFELVLDTLAATEDSEPPETAMAIETLNSAYNDYLKLAGWGSQA